MTKSACSRYSRRCRAPRDVPHCYANLCEALVVTGQLPEVVKAAFDGRVHARRLGFARSFGALLAAYAAEGLLEAGDWEQAVAILGEVLRTGATF